MPALLETMAIPRGGVLPSGDQFEIVYGAQRAVVVEVGGGLRVYRAVGPPNAFRTGESPILLGPGESATSRWGIEP